MATKPDDYPDNALVVTSDSPGGEVSPDTEAEHQQRAEDQARLHQIRERFQVHQTFWSGIHAEGLKDDKFVAGEQWPTEIKKEREDKGRPVMTYNLIPAFNRQIINKVRETQQQIKVIPVESNKGPSPKLDNVGGTNDYSMADVYSGIIKNIEHLSRADQAYDTALKHAVDHGFGFFYMMNEWSRVDPFVQDLVIKRVKNSYSVMMDPDAQEADFRDSQDAFIFVNMKRKTFEKKYSDHPPIEFEQHGLGANYEGWFDPDNVRIAQYFFMDYQDDEVLQLSNGKIVYLSMVEEILDELEEEEGIHIKKRGTTEMRKAVKRPVCMWQKMTANHVIEGPIELPFSAIPIFPVLGEELIIDGRTRYESAHRHARDAQRDYNYWRTSGTETIALAPRAPWVATARQIAGFEDMYETANTENHPVLYYNHIDGQNPPPPPQRQYPTALAATEMQQAAVAANDMQQIIGLHEASLGAESNEKSGRAIRARQSQGATSTFQFPDNLRRAQEQCGRLGVEAIPKLMTEERIVRIRLPDDTDDFVSINESKVDNETGRTVLFHDIAYGKYDVVMDTGKSYETQREEAAELQMELLKVLGPEAAQNIAHLIVKNLGTPGSEEVATILRKMLPDALKSEDEKIADLPKGVMPDPDNEGQFLKDGQPWTPPPTLEQQIAQKQQQIDELEHTAALEKHKATQAQAAADTKEAEADIAKAQAEMAALQQQAEGAGLVEGADSGQMMTEIEQIIQRTMQEHEDSENAHKDITQGMIADAIVEALKRVRALVDKKTSEAMKQTAAEMKETAGTTDNVVPINDQVTIASDGVKMSFDNIKRDEGGEITGADVVVNAGSD